METLPKLGKSDDRRLILWIRAGGRCELASCNRYLLTNEEIGDWAYYTLGEAAHNVARTKTATRGDGDLAMELRNDVSNLLLLCPGCHKTVDKKLKAAEFTVEELMHQKLEHEERVYQLTSIKPGHETRVLRMLGKIHGTEVSAPVEDIRPAVVRETGRYPRYAFAQNEVDIDLRGLPEEAGDAYWKMGCSIIDRQLTKFFTIGLDGKLPPHMTVFAFARIPLLVYLGTRLSDKISTVLVPKKRSEQEPWGWDDGETVDFELSPVQELGEGAPCGLLLSVSGEVTLDSVPEHLRSTHTLYELRPKHEQPDRPLVATPATLQAFRGTYATALRMLEGRSPSRIALFPAVPLTVGVTLGREFLPAVTPSVTVFDNVGGTFIETITIDPSTL